MSELEQQIKELTEEKRKLMKRIINANKVLKNVPLTQTVYCGGCGRPLKDVPLSRLQKKWLEQLRDALLFSEEE